MSSPRQSHCAMQAPIGGDKLRASLGVPAQPGKLHLCPGSVFRQSQSAFAAQMLTLPSAEPLSRCDGAAPGAGAKKRTALTAPSPGFIRKPISVLVCQMGSIGSAKR